MRLAIMQPYFMPYLGYFSLIAATDRFVVFDEAQYIRHGWINRNRILKPGCRETQFIGYPVARHRRATPIATVSISKNHDWKQRILGQIQHYKKRAKFFSQGESLLQRCLSLASCSALEFNVHCLKIICRELKLKIDFMYSSNAKFDRNKMNHPGQWALAISNSVGATCYVNPIAGRELFAGIPFSETGVQLRFLENRLSPYRQGNLHFIPALSILDVIMFNGLQQTRRLIDQYKVFNADLVYRIDKLRQIQKVGA